MQHLDRILVAAAAAGAWTLITLQFMAMDQSHAQQRSDDEAAQETTARDEVSAIHASDIVGLSAVIEKSIREHQTRPQSMRGLDQYVKSIVRGCRISGTVRGDRISSANISC